MKVSDLGTIRKERDYYQSPLAFNIGTNAHIIMNKISKANSIDLLNCYGPTNRLIKLMEKIPEPNNCELEELNHYRTKRNCLYIELQKRLKAFDHFKQRLDADKTIRETLTNGELPN